MQPDTIEANSNSTVYDTIIVHFSKGLELSPELSNKVDNYIESQQLGIFDYALPLISILIALIAVYISLKAYNHNRKQGVISLKPLLIFREETSHRTGKIRLYIANKGVGPLTFLDFEMEYEGKQYMQMRPLFNTVCEKFRFKKNDFKFDYQTFTNPLAEYSMKINEEKTLIKYHLNGKTFKESKDFYNEFKKIKVTFRYSDLNDNIVANTYSFKY